MHPSAALVAPAITALALAGCCFGGSSTSPVPVAPPAPSVPSGPATPGCPELGSAIVGTWERPGYVEEYGPDGSYVINGRRGTIQWVRPGHAVLEVPEASFRAEYDLALADPGTLLAVDPHGIGTTYQRASAAPAIPPACFDLRAAIVGTWVGGPAPETYTADGRYRVMGEGRWSFPAPGRLQLVRDDGVTSDYWFAMPTPDVAVAISMPPLEPRGIVYTRQR